MVSLRKSTSRYESLARSSPYSCSGQSPRLYARCNLVAMLPVDATTMVAHQEPEQSCQSSGETCIQRTRFDCMPVDVLRRGGGLKSLQDENNDILSKN